MIFKYPESHNKSIIKTGITLLAIGLILFFFFISQIFQNIPALRFIMFVASLGTIIGGLPRIISGYKHQLICYELVYTSFKILHLKSSSLLLLESRRSALYNIEKTMLSLWRVLK